MPGMGDGVNNSSPKTSTSLCLTSLSNKVPQTEKSSTYIIVFSQHAVYSLTILYLQKLGLVTSEKSFPFTIWEVDTTSKKLFEER